MEELYRNLSIASLWTFQDCGDAECPDVEVMDLWLSHQSGVVSAKVTRIEPGDLDKTLQQTSRSLIARFVLVEASKMEKVNVSFKDPEVGESKKSARLNISKQVRKMMLKAFGLELAYDYLSATVAGVTAFPRSASRKDERTYSFAYAPKLGALWSHKRFAPDANRQPLTQGLLIMQNDLSQPHPKFPSKYIHQTPIKELLQTAMKVKDRDLCPWHPSLCQHPMFPAFILSLTLGIQIDEIKLRIGKYIGDVEGITGHTVFKDRKGAYQQTEVLATYSATASGYASKLASAERKSKSVERLLQFMELQMDEDAQTRRNAAESSPETASDEKLLEGEELLRSHVAELKRRLVNQTDDVAYTLKRVQVQIDALFSLIAQKDSLHNIVLSQSMKLLAVVTMFYLPGSFVSSLFSTSVFDWDSRDLRNSSIAVPLTPQFRLYWAVTLPLTILTFIAYFLWFVLQKKESNSRFELAEEKVAQDHAADKRSLQTRRSTRLWPRNSRLSSKASMDSV